MLEGFAAASKAEQLLLGKETLSSGRPSAPKLFFSGLGGVLEQAEREAEAHGFPFSVSILVCNGSFLALEGSYEGRNRS